MTFSVGPNQYKDYSVGAINFDPRDIGHLGPFQPSRNLGAFENRPPYDVNSGVKPGLPRLNTAHELATGLVGAWPMAQLSGTTVLDLSWNGNHGTATGAQWQYNAALGATWDCDSGHADQIEVNPGGTVVPSGDMTVAVWVRWSAANAGLPGFITNWRTPARFWLGCWNDEDTLHWQVVDGIGVTREVEITDAAFSDGSWHLIVGRCTAGSGVELSVDGGKWTATSVAAMNGAMGAVTQVDIGGWSSADSEWQPIDGNIADVRIWDRVLSDAEISRMYADPWSLYTVTTKPDYPVLDTSNPLSDWVVAALPVYEGSGTTVSDISDNGNDGTVQGSGSAWGDDTEHGPYLDTNGTAYIQLSSSDSTQEMGQTGSISLLVKYPVLSSGKHAFDLGTYGNRIYFEFDSSSTGLLKYDDGSPAGGSAVGPLGDYWSNFTCTWDGTTARAYIDGIEIDNFLQTGSISLTNSLQIGSRNDGGRITDMQIANILLFDRALPASDVADLAEDPWLLYLDGEAVSTPTSHDASATISLPSLGITATASVSGSNDASATIPLPSLGITATATNVGANDASATIPLPSLGITATGNNERILDASASINLPSLGITATGSTIGANDASATITLPSLGITATAANITPGTNAAQADITLPSLGITGSGVNIGNNRTTANINLPSLGITASVTNLGHNDASAIVNLPRLGISASVVNVGNNDASANVNLPSLGITASGSNSVPQVNQGTANIELPSLGITASSTNVGFNDASVSAGLPSLGISGTGRSYDPTVNIGSVIVAFGKLGLTASATNITPPRTVYPESRKTTFYETIVTSGTIESSAFVPSYEMRKKLYDLIRTSPDKHFKAIRAAFATFKTFLNDNLYIYNDQVEKQEVECISAKQERAIAKLSQEKNLILPLASLSLQDIDLYNEKQKYAPILVHDKYWDDEAKTAYRVIREVGKSVNISMDLHLWSKYMTDMVELAELVEFLFRPNLCLKSTEANNTKFFLDGSSDISETVVSDGENRILRKVYSIRCETYIYGKQFRVTNTGEIEEFNVEWEIDQ